ncbi:23S rRNA (guanosine-2'-O-) -methyltransferase rlmB [Candidatus Nasuia deltocephalinicola]|nr:23S rRNA (guanosine-2'-O-) -methyltransferase rlmB [Candidatus Nasuia deltocephalinicola]
MIIYNNIYKIYKIYFKKKNKKIKFLIDCLKFCKIKIIYKKNIKKNIICKINYKINLYKINKIIKKKKNKKLLFIGIYKFTNINNIGSCLRTISGAGGDGLIIFKNKLSINSKIIDISLGSIVPIFIKKKFLKSLINMKKKGIIIICMDEKSKSSLFEKINLKKNILFLIGNENYGIKNKLIKNLCNYTISIPMLGNIKNLNVATVVSICLYETIRQREF